MKRGTIRITGTAPMLMHSDRLANPLDPATIKHQELTKIRTKTRDIHEAIMRSLWFGSLYLDSDNRVVMPGQNIRKVLIEGARFHKRGKDIERGVIINTEHSPLEYNGPKDIEKLWEKKEFRDIRSVVVARRRVMTCRPRFNEWSCNVDILYDDTVINTGDLNIAIEQAGQLVGLCDYRPLFGRFQGELING